MKLPKGLQFGRDYDGWALLSTGPAPRWSHFVSSPMQPASPAGCVPVKLTQVCFVVVKQIPQVDQKEENEYDGFDFTREVAE